jgi:hypothetical protein
MIVIMKTTRYGGSACRIVDVFCLFSTDDTIIITPTMMMSRSGSLLCCSVASMLQALIGANRRSGTVADLVCERFCPLILAATR